MTEPGVDVEVGGSGANAFTVTRQVHGDVVRLAVRGELDEGAQVLSAIVVDATGHRGARTVVIDLHDVTFLAAAGLHVLVDGHHAARRAGCAFRVVGARDVVAHVLHLTGLDVTLDIDG